MPILTNRGNEVTIQTIVNVIQQMQLWICSRYIVMMKEHFLLGHTCAFLMNFPFSCCRRFEQYSPVKVFFFAAIMITSLHSQNTDAMTFPAYLTAFTFLGVESHCIFYCINCSFITSVGQWIQWSKPPQKYFSQIKPDSIFEIKHQTCF